ncbi:unnamed protein product [Colias eurytheme]|nr:unnamed protein product [Colias eurytheme]
MDENVYESVEGVGGGVGAGGVGAGRGALYRWWRVGNACRRHRRASQTLEFHQHAGAGRGAGGAGRGVLCVGLVGERLSASCSTIDAPCVLLLRRRAPDRHPLHRHAMEEHACCEADEQLPEDRSASASPERARTPDPPPAGPPPGPPPAGPPPAGPPPAGPPPAHEDPYDSAGDSDSDDSTASSQQH